MRCCERLRLSRRLSSNATFQMQHMLLEIFRLRSGRGTPGATLKMTAFSDMARFTSGRLLPPPP
jgi:hypothetical protein